MGTQIMRLSTKSRRLKRICCIKGFAILLFFLSSCTNLTHISQFAKFSTESATYTKLTEDYIDYPDRIKHYQPKNQQSHLKKIKEERDKQKDDLLALHKVIAEYMAALGKLASDDLISYDSELDSMSTALKNSNFTKQETADAFGKISKTLFKAFTDNWRKGKLKELIQDSNNDFKKLVIALKNIVGEDFFDSLVDEKDSIDKYFKKNLKAAEESGGQNASIVLLWEWHHEKIQIIETKKSTVKNYAKILEKIWKGHEELYKNRSDLSKKEIFNTIINISKDLKAIHKTIKSL